MPNPSTTLPLWCEKGACYGDDSQSPASRRWAGPRGFTYYFHDGTVRLYDASPLLEKGGVFAPLRDDAIFRERLTVLNDTVAWDLDGNRDPAACIDLDPCELYESCPVVEDPLKEAI